MFKSLGLVSFVIDDMISRLLTTWFYGWMGGWIDGRMDGMEYSFSGIGFNLGTVTLHGRVGVGSSPFNFILHY